MSPHTIQKAAQSARGACLVVQDFLPLSDVAAFPRACRSGSAIVRLYKPPWESAIAAMASTTAALPQAMQEDPSLLDAIHVMLCEWTAEELRGTESSDEGNTIALDDAADNVCLQGGRVASSELYAWLRQQLPPHLRPRLYEEAMRLEWPFLPPGLPEKEYRHVLLLRALRWHDDWGYIRDTLEEQLKDMYRDKPQRKKPGHVATEVSRVGNGSEESMRRFSTYCVCCCPIVVSVLQIFRCVLALHLQNS